MKNYLFIFFGLQSVLCVCQDDKQTATDSLKTIEFGEVVITATRTERQLSSLPVPSQIITKAQIRQQNAVRLGELLNELTGVITVPDFGGGEGIQMQGLDSEYTLILIDGVPLVGREAGTLDINRITVGNIKQIEIIKGASSCLYGTEALGGVINIITEKSQQGFSGNAQYRLGSFHSHDVHSSINYQRNKAGFQFFINRNSSQGYDLDKTDALKTVNPFYNYTLSSKFLYQFSAQTEALFSARYYTQNQENTTLNNTGESRLNEWNLHAKVNHKWREKWASYLNFYATSYQAREFLNDSNVLSVHSDFNQLLVLPEFQISYQPDNHGFIAGIGGRYETIKRTDFVKNPTFEAHYFYAQYDGNPHAKVNVVSGIRYDNHTAYHSQFSPKLAIRYALINDLAVRFSVGYGFKAPDFRQLYFDFSNSSVGYTVLGYNAVPSRLPALQNEGSIRQMVVPLSEFNDRLSPESSISWNFGFQYEPNVVWSFEGNFFRNDIRNLIDIRVVANKTNGQNVFSYFNVNQVVTTGLELNLDWKITKNFKFKGGYQLLYAHDKAAIKGFEKGEIFARNPETQRSFQLDSQHYFGLFNRSRHLANAKVYLEIPTWNMHTNFRTTYRSKYGLFDSNGNAYLDDYDAFVKGYFVLDWAMNKKFGKRSELGLGIDNILNFRDIENISTIAGRIFYTKLQINF